MRLCLRAFGLWLLAFAFGAGVLVPGAWAQGFGNGKKTVKLQRKLPAAVHLPGTTINLQATARDSANADVAQSLSDLLATELQKEDKRIRIQKTSADAVVTCLITEFQTPPPQSFTRNEIVLQKGHDLEEPKKYYKVTGSLGVAYQTKDSRGKVLDSDNVTANYSQEFEADTNQASGESFGAKMTGPFKRMAGKKTGETYGPPTQVELRQILLTRAVSQLAARLVNTEETLEVPLARGKLDDANHLAEKGQWSRNLETLETMTPFPNASDDAYRIYNIGVAYEALAYQSEDKAATKKLLEQAAINYGKAIDAKPSEKFFIEPQNRIETAIAHYKKLEGGSTVAAKADTPPFSVKAGSPPSTVSNTGTSARGTTGARSATTSSSAPKPAGKSSSAMTNDDVIRMAAAGVDEDSIIAAIHDAPAVHFDLSPDGLIQLANNGVKGKIVSAMRERARRAAVHRTSPSPNPK